MRTDTPTLDAPGRAPGAATDDELRELDSGLDALQAVDSTRRTGLAGWDWSRVLLPVAAVVLLVAIWQAFAVLLPVRSVGVMGDGRTYDQVCALRAVTSTDGMTADVYPFDMGLLTRVANRIVNEVRGINRVTYDITSKPPGTIEWE